MAKTQLTKDIEEALYFFEIERGEIVVEEVGMPDDHGIVDTLALRTLPDGSFEWRCYEIKVSKSDFRSKARITFVGHYNYYVLPKFLYEQVKDEIPSCAGVLLYLPFQDGYALDGVAKGTLSIVKKASRQDLLFPENFLLHSFLHSLFREVRKAKRVEKGLAHYASQELLVDLKRRGDGFYPLLLDEVEQESLYDLEAELQATKEELQAHREKRRHTEAYL